SSNRTRNQRSVNPVSATLRCITGTWPGGGGGGGSGGVSLQEKHANKPAARKTETMNATLILHMASDPIPMITHAPIG
ncbi:MAG TPA: hypothetical protein DGH68_02295, partial [Bacteroidetes bacterium]|nr:hypothetical protein [Bacteroidota bacterium]